MLASLNGDAGLVKLLIDKGAEVSKKGWAPLHYAATNGHDDVVKICSTTTRTSTPRRRTAPRR
jgi:ankyrin repeat protein